MAQDDGVASLKRAHEVRASLTRGETLRVHALEGSPGGLQSVSDTRFPGTLWAQTAPRRPGARPLCRDAACSVLGEVYKVLWLP